MACQALLPLVCVLLVLSCAAAQRPLVVAHRGASGKLPEHTREAYLEAMKEGADFIECDVVVTKDLALICRHEPQLNDTTDAATLFANLSTTYEIDGTNVTGIFASDLTLAQIRQLRATQRLPFRDQSLNGRFAVPTFAEYIDIALAAGGPVGIYPESKHPAWHNSLPVLKAANTTMEQLMVDVLRSKGYAASAPLNSTAWRGRPIFLQSFEINSLRRFADLAPGVPLVYLLDDAPDPDTRMALTEIVSDSNLKAIRPFVSVVSPWKGLLYYVVRGADTQQRLHSSGLSARLHQRGFGVHTYTIRNEAQFVLPTCGGDVECELRFLFQTEKLEGAFADYPDTFAQWVQRNYT